MSVELNIKFPSENETKFKVKKKIRRKHLKLDSSYKKQLIKFLQSMKSEQQLSPNSAFSIEKNIQLNSIKSQNAYLKQILEKNSNGVILEEEYRKKNLKRKRIQYKNNLPTIKPKLNCYQKYNQKINEKKLLAAYQWESTLANNYKKYHRKSTAFKQRNKQQKMNQIFNLRNKNSQQKEFIFDKNECRKQSTRKFSSLKLKLPQSDRDYNSTATHQRSFSIGIDQKINSKNYQNIQKPETSQKKQQHQINPFNLETYFIQLMKKQLHQQEKNNSELSSSYKKNSIIFPEKINLLNFVKNYIPQNKMIKMQIILDKDNFDIQYFPENFYFGEMEQGNKHGWGVYITKKCKFEGSWSNNNKVKGFQKNQVGVYHGQFANDLREGKGQFSWYNGEYYSGEWRKGKKHGNGFWKSKNNDNYVGEWIDGYVSGFGVHKASNKQCYEGQFKNFLKHGNGKQKFPNGDSYVGEYLNGKPDGKGKYQWYRRASYEGQFKNGFRHGKGILKTNQSLVYNGNFINEKAEGDCRIDYPQGNYYIGQFKNGKKNGKGILQIKNNKQILQGIWINDIFQPDISNEIENLTIKD